MNRQQTPTLTLIAVLFALSLPSIGQARAPAKGSRVLPAVKLLELPRLPRAKDTATSLSPDGRWLARAASGGKRGVLELWDLSTKKRRWSKRIAMPQRDGQTRVISSPDGRFVALAGFSRRSGRLQVYRVATGPRVLSDGFPRDAKKALQQLFSWQITPGNLLLARFAESLRVYDLPRGKRRFAISGCGTGADQGGGQEEGDPMIAFSKDERFITTTHWGMDTLSVWSLKTGKLHKELKLHTCKNPDDVRCGTGSIFVDFIASTPPLVMASGLYGAVWELPSGKRRFVFDDTAHAPASKPAPDYHVIGRRLLLETRDKFIVRDLRTGLLRVTAHPHVGYRLNPTTPSGPWQLWRREGAPPLLSHRPSRRSWQLRVAGKRVAGLELDGVQLVGAPGKKRPLVVRGRTVWAWPLSKLEKK